MRAHGIGMSLLAVNDLKNEIDEETVSRVIKLCDWQLAVRKIHDPINADNKIAKMEEKNGGYCPTARKRNEN